MDYIVDVLTLTAVLTIAVHGYMLIKGLGGMLHLGHTVFYGLGAYASAVLTTTILPPGTFLISLLAGVLVAMAGAYLIGWVALRERGRYFMIVTFAVQLIFVTLVINFDFTGGPDGISSVPRMSLGPWQMTIRSELDLGVVTLKVSHINLLLIVGFATLSFFFCRFIIGSPFGRLVRATREDELAVEAYGRSAMPIKLSILAIGAGLTGAAGSIFAHYFNYVGPFQFELDLVVLFLMMLILGGQYNLVGATVGTVLMIVLLEFLRYLLEDILSVPFEVTAHMREVVFSVILILVLLLRPGGLLPERFKQYVRHANVSSRNRNAIGAGSVGGRRPADSVAIAAFPSPRSPDNEDGPEGRVASGTAVDDSSVLCCRGLSKRFGGISAVNGADIELLDGKILAVIGPNGAGKTTVFNLLSGFEQPDEGKVYTRGLDITGRSPATIAGYGIARTFQDVRIWKRLTVIENVLAVFPDQVGEQAVGLLTGAGRARRTESENIEQAWLLLERFGLEDKANQIADQLSYAQKKMLSLARLTAFRPRVMLLDEPTAGVDLRRLETFLDHIQGFSTREKSTVCLIEHNMTVVRELADWVVFMDQGKVLAGGPPQEVLGDRHLMTIYLGQSAAAS